MPADESECRYVDAQSLKPTELIMVDAKGEGVEGDEDRDRHGDHRGEVVRSGSFAPLRNNCGRVAAVLLSARVAVLARRLPDARPPQIR